MVDYPGGTALVDIRRRRELADLALARGGPTSATLVRPRGAKTFCKKGFGFEGTERLDLAALVGHEGRRVTLVDR